MSVGDAGTVKQASTAAPVPGAVDDDRRARWRKRLSFRNMSALYILVAIFVIFAIWVPDTFLNADVQKSLLDTSSLNALVAVGVILPLSAGVINLAIGAEVGLAAIVSAYLLSKAGMAIVPTVLITLLVGACVGVVSGLLVTKARIDSIIATLGLSSVLLALIQWISGSQQILDLGAKFQELGTNRIVGITYPVWLMLIVAIVVWYVLERTPAGRRVYATGGNLEAAKLAGVNTSRVVVLTLVACGVIAAAAGTLASSRLATGDPTIGPSYLLPAMAAAFLGSTQFRGGRYNVWGTVVAVYVLAEGVKGLQLAGAPTWIPDLFNGAALLLAVGLAKYQGLSLRGGARGRMSRRGGTDPTATTAGVGTEGSK